MDHQLLARVDQWLIDHRQKIVDDLIGLVNIPSVSEPGSKTPPFGKPCQDALKYMFDLAENHDYTWKNYGNYIGEILFTKGDSSVGIWAHLDVVPVGDPSKWDYPPYDATVVENRYIIGRGVQDNKSPAIATFHVMNCLRDLQIPLKHNYSLFLGTNEECGMEDVKHFVKHHPCPDISIVPDS
ncbi:MAG: M20 family metallopeptidase, partial [Clostridiales bacterium]|nr:M20 family metallopeptidase [Clostridiales bacterium]